MISYVILDVTKDNYLDLNICEISMLYPRLLAVDNCALCTTLAPVSQ
jgi:hypothetical protein